MPEIAEKFIFKTKDLLSKGPKVARNRKELKEFLKTENSKMTADIFISALKADKSAGENVLTMMKLRAMIAEKRRLSDDTKETTHITFPLSDKDKQKIKQIPGYYNLEGIDDSVIKEFIKNYRNVTRDDVEETVNKISTVLEPKKRSDVGSTRRDLFKFTVDHPITIKSDIIKIEQSKDSSKIYVLDESKFREAAQSLKSAVAKDHLLGMIKTFEKYKGSRTTDWFMPSSIAPEDDDILNEYISQVKELVGFGTINGKLPPQ